MTSLLYQIGLDWLKIHVINLTGLKKRDSVANRLIYANEVIDDIIDSARNPLQGRRWWMDSDEPWETLAACMDVADALDYPGGPENYPSRLPVHQDGSCNGLQHYAALGRDQAGGKSVNLCPSEFPQVDCDHSRSCAVFSLKCTDFNPGFEGINRLNLRIVEFHNG